MNLTETKRTAELTRRLLEAEATVKALLSGQIDAVVDTATHTPVLLAKAQEALHASEERYRSIVETANEGIWTLDTNSKVTFANQRLAELLGFSVAQMLGRSLFDFLPEPAKARATQRLQNALHGVSEESEIAVLKSDGSYLWALIKTSPIHDSAGKYSGVLCMMTDHTGHRTAEAARSKSEERYRLIVETANEGIATLDEESVFTFANRPFAEMLGYSVVELVGKPLRIILPPGSIESADARMQRSREGHWEEHEVIYLRKDGSELFAMIKTSPIQDADGNWIGTLGMITDRTRYRQAEDDLRKSETQYRQIVEATSDGIIQFDGVGKILFVNRRYAELLGYQPAEMIGTSVFALQTPAALEQAVHQMLRDENDAIDTTLLHKDGREIAVNVASSRMVDAAGQHLGHMAVVRDFTEQKKLQSQLMVSDRMASVGTLAAGVAHEINNPLAAVVANLDYISEGLGRAISLAEIKPALDDAREAAEQVRFIVRDLKIFSRAPSDEPKGTADVKAIMESSLRMAWNEIRHRAAVVKHYGLLPPVEANEARLGQVFLNLIVNAAQAIPEGRAEHNEIRLTTRVEGDRVVVEVADSGAGIPPEIIGRIFDPFFTTKAVGVGTGLGLAICHRLVTDMGGQLTVETELGKGTTFRVTLPIARKDEVEPPGAAVAPLPTLPAARRGQVMVVDDEELVVRGVKRILAKEHDITTATAREALAICAAGRRFDLILCDLMMPDMTGMDLHEELSRVAPDQANRMIFLTGGAFTARARQFLSETPKEHIEKPFDPANLRAVVRRYLR